MRLWFRLVLFFLLTPFRPRLKSGTDLSNLNYRVHLSDIDTNVHLNNGQYLTFMDLGRLDLMVRTGLWKAVMRHKWMPVVSGAKIRFRKEIRLFEPFTLESRIVYWNEETSVIEQRFRFRKGPKKGILAATALVRVGLYDRKARKFVPMAQLMKEIGVDEQSPSLQPHIEAFLNAEGELRTYDRQEATQPEKAA
ncbi:thioesterase family protein [Pseudovibrio exalbescens]|uniref:thioesterase family protein n=1 Tax=Pseudovibrio exalbescens TaxID=197461 RepID=UPI000C9A6528|nr:thioesterase family protein [Pseudovibrio exalbescens]